MIFLLVGSVLIDPLVLLAILYTLAKSQVDTSYSGVLIVNLVLSTVGAVAAYFLLPGEDPVSLWVGGGAFFVFASLVITKVACVSAGRGIASTLLFLAYKVFIIYAVFEMLHILGVDTDLGRLELEALSEGQTPQFIRWFLDNAIWFESQR